MNTPIVLAYRPFAHFQFDSKIICYNKFVRKSYFPYSGQYF